VFIRDVFYTFAAELLSAMGNLAVGVVLARALLPDERGALVLVMTLPWVIANAATFGLPQANVYLTGRQKYDIRAILGNSLVLSLVVGLVLVALFYALQDVLFRTVFRGLPTEYWLPLLILLPVPLLDVMMLSVLVARQQFDLFNMRRVAMPALMLVGFVGSLALDAGGLRAAIGVYIAVNVIVALLSLVFAGRRVPLSLRPNWRLTVESLRFGYKSYIENLMIKLNYRVDVYVLAYLLPTDQLAFYGVATSLAEVAWYFPNSVGTVLFPRLSNTPEGDIFDVTARVCRSALALTGLIVVAMLATSWLFVPQVYGSPYRATVLPLVILLPGVVFMTVHAVLARSFTSRNRQRVLILAAGLALLTNLGLDWAFIPRWGIAGAAIASTVGNSVAGGVLLHQFLRDAGLPWRQVLVPRLDELLGHWAWLKLRLGARRLEGRRTVDGADGLSDTEHSDNGERAGGGQGSQE